MRRSVDSGPVPPMIPRMRVTGGSKLRRDGRPQRRRQEADARPAIRNPLASIDQCDTVVLGSPIWNVRAPMVMTTFAEAFDFTGKVHPFTK
jgi:Flavodoxin